MLDWLFNIGALFTKQNISIHFAKNTDMKLCYQVLRMRQYVEKLTGYHGEWSPLGSPKAKPERPQAQRFCPRDFPKDSIYYDTLKPFPHIFILLSSWTSITSSKEGFFFIQCNGLSREYDSECFVAKVQTLIEVNPNKLVWDEDRMMITFIFIENEGWVKNH